MRPTSPEDQLLATKFVEGFNAADKDRISVHWLLAVEKANEAIEMERSFRLIGGYDQLVNAMAATLDPAFANIQLETIVSAVHWQPNRVKIEASHATTGERSSFMANRAGIALPLGVLQAAAGSPGSVRFEPELTSKREALAGLVMGPVIKLVIRFREAFWESAAWDLSFLHLTGEAFPTWWTSLPLRRPVLTGWLGGRAAKHFSDSSDEDIFMAGLKVLQRALNGDRSLQPLVEAWDVANWQLAIRFHAAPTVTPPSADSTLHGSLPHRLQRHCTLPAKRPRPAPAAPSPARSPPDAAQHVRSWRAISPNDENPMMNCTSIIDASRFPTLTTLSGQAAIECYEITPPSASSAMPGPSRRQFISAAGLALAGGYFVAPARTAESVAVTSPNSRWRIGAIGMRHQGTVITREALPFGDVVAICDVDKNVRDQAQPVLAARPSSTRTIATCSPTTKSTLS